MITFETSPISEFAIEATVAMRSFVRWSPAGAPAWNPAFMVIALLGTRSQPAHSILQGIAYISRVESRRIAIISTSPKVVLLTMKLGQFFQNLFFNRSQIEFS